ncbi:aldo/keto reductase [Actinoplanes sp. TRM 88003]|uniref:Aldo/keto reductase n=1 Tax=Paractinoplanes aksuensis TaxID=2939490 RepID=A0ABT1E3Z3_9ACTN|nr:aldo/keto reductase [Actinoplanes aksuensis]MCO8277762.1 aldo/keto reductase [Actinoplanes aksuensis]
MSAIDARTILGTAALGDRPDEDEAVATVLAAARDGVCGLDTSPWYGRGAAERRVGRALAGLPHDVTVSTKVGYVVDPPGDRRQDFSGDAVLRSLEASLNRLGVTAIDTVLIHDPENHMREALEGAYPVLHRLRSEGVVRAIGVGMNEVAGPLRFVRETDLDVVLIAGRYTLLDRSAGDELLPLCRERGVEVWAGGVFNTGVLAVPEPGAHYDYAPASPQILARAKALRYRCAEYGIPLAAAALQFPARHPAVRAVLLGPADRAQLTENLHHWRLPIPDELWSDLNAGRAS